MVAELAESSDMATRLDPRLGQRFVLRHQCFLARLSYCYRPTGSGEQRAHRAQYRTVAGSVPDVAAGATAVYPSLRLYGHRLFGVWKHRRHAAHARIVDRFLVRGVRLCRCHDTDPGVWAAASL